MGDYITSIIHDKREDYWLKSKAIIEIANELVNLVEKNISINVNELNFRVCKKLGITQPPKLYEIISAIPQEYIKSLLPKIRVKPSRTTSGIAIIAVMSKPHRCPHLYYTGHVCVYCPGGPDSDFDYSAQSFSGHEPTSKRAKSVRFDPYLQVHERVSHMERLGHNVDKIELIVMGGTFMSTEKAYRDKFILDLHDALSGHISKSLEEAIFFGERSLKHRCVGLTIETRPDYCQIKHIREMLSYGATRLELGVQSIYEDVALDTNRGHTVASSCNTMRMVKEYGFKVTAHMMPDLPNVGIERDSYQFEEYFKNPDFRTDGLKIYPTLVVRGTGLYELWKTKRYQNYSATMLIDLICYIMSLVPPWVRVYRVQRDMPTALVSSCGAPFCHLRELVLERMKVLGLTTRDVRTREVGHKDLHDQIKPTQSELIRRDYYANGGWETFLSYEDPKTDIIIGLLRLRKCAENPFTGVKNWSVVRELHIYGSAVAISERDDSKYQHKGYGTSLMNEAERIALHEHGSSQLGVIAGVGVRNYYKKLGYKLLSPYMVKDLI